MSRPPKPPRPLAIRSLSRFPFLTPQCSPARKGSVQEACLEERTTRRQMERSLHGMYGCLEQAGPRKVTQQVPCLTFVDM